MHLVTNYPVIADAPYIEAQNTNNRSLLWQRQLEIEEVLQRNLNNTLVTAIHLLISQASAGQRLQQLSLHNKHKIVVHEINSLPKYKDFFLYVSEKLLNKLVAVLNMDIYIGEGFELLNKTLLVTENISYVLTRHGRQERHCDMSRGRGYCDVRYIGSHDTFVLVLKRPLDKSELSQLDYSANRFGSENRLIWLLKYRLKMKLRNPCKILKTYHSHCIDVRGARRLRGRIGLRVENVEISGLK